MRYQLDLVLKPAEGALLRVIGMTERRGFSIYAIHGSTIDSDAGRWQLQLEVEGGTRQPQTLQRQLEKVYDCISVTVTALDSAEVAA